MRFTKNNCLVVDESENSVMEGVRLSDNCYLLTPPTTCLKAGDDEAELWHRKFGHVNYHSMKKAVSVGALRGIPDLKIDSWKLCGPCIEGKQVKVTHKVLQHLVTSRVLQLLHMDLMGPMQVESIGGKMYAFVCVDDFSRFTWVQFIQEKSDTFEVFKALCSRLQTEKCSNIGKIVRIRSDHGGEFENAIFAEYCNKHGISHEFSAPKTPEQNGVVERKNRTIQEMARVMLKAKCGEFPSVPARKKKSRGSKSVPTPEYGKAVVKEIAGGVRTTWGRSKSFPSSQLTSKYAILEHLALYNWVPSNHQISVLKPMTVLLYKLGKGISFNLVHEEELCEKSAGEMCISKKFFQGQYIQDIQGELIYPDLVFGV